MEAFELKLMSHILQNYYQLLLRTYPSFNNLEKIMASAPQDRNKQKYDGAPSAPVGGKGLRIFYFIFSAVFNICHILKYIVCSF
jgi:hypothetical protein